MESQVKKNPVERICDSIVELLAKGTIPWTQPWVVNSTGIVSHDRGKPYSLRNRMLLQYGGEYATLKQINAAGGRVKKGEKSQVVYFAKWYEKRDEEGELKDRYYFLKAFNVFRVGSQTEGVEAKYAHLWEGGGLPKDDGEILQHINAYCERTGVKLLAGGSEAFYNRTDDTIQVPGVDTFINRSQYWHTVFHELVHSSGSPERLARVKGKVFGDSNYATEELVADIGACLCLGHLNIDTTECIPNTAAYIACWKRNIKMFGGGLLNNCIREAERAMQFIFNINTQQQEADNG